MRYVRYFVLFLLGLIFGWYSLVALIVLFLGGGIGLLMLGSPFALMKLIRRHGIERDTLDMLPTWSTHYKKQLEIEEKIDNVNSGSTFTIGIGFGLMLLLVADFTQKAYFVETEIEDFVTRAGILLLFITNIAWFWYMRHHRLRSQSYSLLGLENANVIQRKPSKSVSRMLGYIVLIISSNAFIITGIVILKSRASDFAQQPPQSSTAESNLSAQQESTWRVIENQVFGIEFSVPKTWGEPTVTQTSMYTSYLFSVQPRLEVVVDDRTSPADYPERPSDSWPTTTSYYTNSRILKGERNDYTARITRSFTRADDIRLTYVYSYDDVVHNCFEISDTGDVGLRQDNFEQCDGERIIAEIESSMRRR